LIRRLLAALAVAGLTAGSAAAGEAQDPAWGEPLRVRNLSPATYLFGLPRPLGAAMRPGRIELSLLTEHSNNFTAAAGDDTTVVFDGSTTVASLAVRGGLAQRWEWGVEIPYVHQAGGFTDGFIEGFHDVFGFPDGERNAVPRDRLEYRVVDQGEELARVTEAQGHLGDVRAWLGYRLHDAPGRQAVLRAMVEAPTGRADDLSGSDGTDFAVWLELVDGRWLESLNTTVTLSGGVTVPGDGDLFAGRQRGAAASAHLGLHYPLTPSVTLRAQLDGHSDVVDSGVSRLAEGALLGTLGGTLRLSRAVRLDLGVIEDLTTGRAPDVVFLVMLGVRF
jgi:hypothetical protein